jgi:uncharacterized membrane protein
MNAVQVSILLLLSASIFVGIDFVWLGLIAKGFYASQVGPLLLKKPNLPAAIVFYFVYTAGLLYLVVLPAIRDASITHAALIGTIFGLLAYGTYDLTNLATLKGWTTKLAIVDMAWGGILTGLTASFSYLVGRALGMV